MNDIASHASDQFWKLYAHLPSSVRQAADKQFGLFRRNPSHPSLQLKPVGSLWSVRVTRAYRALAYREANAFYWFWIGSHDEYERLIDG